MEGVLQEERYEDATDDQVQRSLEGRHPEWLWGNSARVLGILKPRHGCGGASIHRLSPHSLPLSVLQRNAP